MNIDVYRVTEVKDGSEYKTLLDNTDQKQVLGTIFLAWVNRMHIMSMDAIKDNILVSIELAKETLEWKKNATLSKRCKSISDYITKGAYTKISLMKVVTNTILSSEGFGLKV
jgi:hypothetical protein